jgi:hypothetical protein
MRLEETLEDIKREWTGHHGADSETYLPDGKRVDGKPIRFDADSGSESMSTKDSECSIDDDDDDGSFSTVSSWTTFTLPMERENHEEYYLPCGCDLVASAKEGLNEICDMFFQTLSNVVQAGNDKKTKLTNTVKSKMNEKMERKRKELAQEKRIEREMQMRNDAMHAREELAALVNLWREGK